MLVSSAEPALAYSSFRSDYYLMNKKIIKLKSSDSRYMGFLGIENNRTLRMSHEMAENTKFYQKM